MTSSDKIKKIVFTGGGSAGHVTPNLALIKKFQQEEWEINYIGSQTGIEKELIAKTSVPYHIIATGKLRRYFSWQNFLDPFKIILGTIQAFILLRRLKPTVVFSKGGFVAFPVVVAAWLNRIPAIIHEADLTIGLTNKLCLPFATKICVAFPETIKQIKNKKKAVITGIPIRKEFFHGNAERGREICGFTPNKKIILVFGGSLGADQINKVVRQLLPDILEHFQIAHVCGENKIDSSCNYKGYKQFAYLHEEFPHVLAAADLVISRSGANSLYELLALHKPNILIPLAKAASRGDQILNAKYSAERGYSEIILQEQLTPELLLEKIMATEKNNDTMIEAMRKFTVLDSTKLIYNIIGTVSCFFTLTSGNVNGRTPVY
ncbi:UDP-N-acetylglucosamine--N-acetylmuramyl-(pentapeptide) pyrophosphoryl-undecaprenol N-acetylglucosamine transferase [Gammaproteobacteria bacterium]